MATPSFIALTNERSEWIPIQLTTHDDVVVVCIPRRTSTNGALTTQAQPPVPSSPPATFMDFLDENEPAWVDAEWQ